MDTMQYMDKNGAGFWADDTEHKRASDNGNVYRSCPFAHEWKGNCAGCPFEFECEDSKIRDIEY